MYIQHLPNYKHNFEHYKQWVTSESPHYIFHYFPNSQAQKDIKNIINTQEKSYQKITGFLNTTNNYKKIEYFFYPNKKIKKKLMGDDWYAQAIYNEFRIHVLYTRKDKPIGSHEDTHLLSLSWGLSTGFLQEGLAEYMVGHAWDGVTHIDYCKKAYNEKCFKNILDLFDHNKWMILSEKNLIAFYSVAGLFVNYLINKYGKKKFENLYQNTQRQLSSLQSNNIFYNIYKKNIKEIETDFKQQLR